MIPSLLISQQTRAGKGVYIIVEKEFEAKAFGTIEEAVESGYSDPEQLLGKITIRVRKKDGELIYLG